MKPSPDLGLRQGPPPPRLLDQLRSAIRMKHYSRHTEQAYVYWARKFISGIRSKWARSRVTRFLEHLAVNKHVAASTQNQALNALVFLYNAVLRKPFGKLGKITRAKRPKRLPTVLTQTEVLKLFMAMQGQYAVMAKLLYGAGLRLTECVTLRVKDINFVANQILVRDGKGFKDRVTMLPEMVKTELLEQVERSRLVHQKDLEAGNGHTTLPYALARKYPNLSKSNTDEVQRAGRCMPCIAKVVAILDVKHGWLGLGFVANRFDVVPVRTNDESGVVVRVVFRTQTRGTIVFATRLQSRAIESFDLLAILRHERQVQRRRFLVGLV